MSSKHEFTIVLAQPEESEDDADRLYEAGCSDGSISTSGGVTRIDFHRVANSLEDAIRSAVGNVHQAGFQVARIEIDSPQYCS
ncbi:MAG TPA: hypothetical protein VGI40_20205 [Pirellulaceae bacterium]